MNIRSASANFIICAGTKDPICAIITSRAACRRKRGLAPHIGAGEDQDPIGRIIQVEIVRNEPVSAVLLRKRFNDGMTALVNREFVA